ncbi:hypothetical protein FRB94_002119 [Tulasnella sp. JGI-2019a]|nr:hypothetical protein FRB94_002119 [Tulasnella sp. JGI-2019a]
MSAKIYIGNLSWNTNDDLLREAFSQFGQVLDCIVMRDRETGRSRGFGFVTYGSEQEAQSAISSMNEQDLDGRRVKVAATAAKVVATVAKVVARAAMAAMAVARPAMVVVVTVVVLDVVDMVAKGALVEEERVSIERPR